MARMKVYEIAKEVNKKSKEIIEFLNKNDIDVTSHMNNIDDKAINLVRKEFSKPQKTKKNSSNINQKKNNEKDTRPSKDNKSRQKKDQQNQSRRNKNIKTEDKQ